MAKLIFKAPYYSPVSRTPEGKSRGGYVKYIATRDGVEILSRSGTAEQWMQLLRSRRNDIAKEMHIAPSHLRWYAAYHNKEKNPHVHMLVWSDRTREA